MTGAATLTLATMSFTSTKGSRATTTGTTKSTTTTSTSARVSAAFSSALYLAVTLAAVARALAGETFLAQTSFTSQGTKTSACGTTACRGRAARGCTELTLFCGVATRRYLGALHPGVRSWAWAGTQCTKNLGEYALRSRDATCRVAWVVATARCCRSLIFSGFAAGTTVRLSCARCRHPQLSRPWPEPCLP
jgi:hypothetical protein